MVGKCLLTSHDAQHSKLSRHGLSQFTLGHGSPGNGELKNVKVSTWAPLLASPMGRHHKTQVQATQLEITVSRAGRKEMERGLPAHASFILSQRIISYHRLYLIGQNCIMVKGLSLSILHPFGLSKGQPSKTGRLVAQMRSSGCWLSHWHGLSWRNPMHRPSQPSRCVK